MGAADPNERSARDLTEAIHPEMNDRSCTPLCQTNVKEVGTEVPKSRAQMCSDSQKLLGHAETPSPRQLASRDSACISVSVRLVGQTR